jgi:hypothetical protein
MPRGRLGLDALRQAEDRAVLEAIQLQRDVGLGIFTDGEYRRSSWLTDLAEAVEGFVPDRVLLEWHGPGGGTEASTARVVGAPLRQTRRLTARIGNSNGLLAPRTLAGAGQASQDGLGERRRGTLGDGRGTGAVGRLEGNTTVAALRYQDINLFSDLALHGMGPGLADGISGVCCFEKSPHGFLLFSGYRAVRGAEPIWCV